MAVPCAITAISVVEGPTCGSSPRAVRSSTAGRPPSGTTRLHRRLHSVRRTWQHGIDLPSELTWPGALSESGQALDLARARHGQGWAAVLYAEPHEGARIVAPDGARLDLEWDMAFAPALWVWLSYGGWPPDEEPSEQIALEPCTSAHDDLASALEAGKERIGPAGGELRWWVRLRLS